MWRAYVIFMCLNHPKFNRYDIFYLNSNTFMEITDLSCDMSFTFRDYKLTCDINFAS